MQSHFLEPGKNFTTKTLTMSRNEDYDEDAFVQIGSALTPYEEDEALKKPVKVQDQVVRDEQGRIRFHGAFTGGFSAGYYNTVGSKEGWTPKTFVSSRNKKANYGEQKPEDYMDDSDLGEFGVAPREVGATATFDNKSERDVAKTKLANVGGALSDLSSLSDLILPSTSTIGSKLLVKLGWRQGQGIGPKVKRKKRKVPAAPAGAKVYGCSMNPDDNDDDSADEFSQDLVFAPKDCNPVSFKAKDNLHGIGYVGLTPAAVSQQPFSLFDAPTVSKGGRKGISGHAFGIGALNTHEQDDEDLYTTDHMSNYNFTLEDEEKSEQPRKSRRDVTTAVADVQRVLEGFHVSSKKSYPKRYYPPPALPRHYRPVKQKRSHDDSRDQAARGGDSRWDSRNKMTASKRSELLGEQPKLKSVFDIISQQDRERIESVKRIPAPSFAAQEAAKVLKSRFQSGGVERSEPEHSREQGSAKRPLVLHVQGQGSGAGAHEATTASEKTEPAPSTSSTSPQPVKQSASSTKKKSPASRPSVASTKELRREGLPLFAGATPGGPSFRPFANDPAKQQRYDNYVALQRHGSKDAYEHVASGHMTEWEREREREEFMRSAQLYKPLSSVMSARFVHQEHKEDANLIEVPAEEEPKETELDKAVKAKKFGKLTRSDLEWHPHKLLCKRFNVPNPFPQSTIVGLPMVKKDKFSIFNFLTVPNETDKEPKEEEVKALPSTEMTPTQKKNVNIFACLDDPNMRLKPASKSTQPDSTSTEDSQGQPSENKDGEQPVAMETASETEVATAAEEPTEERPPMDLFKAIFADSDVSDDEDADVPAPEAEPAPESPGHTSQPENESSQTDNAQDDEDPPVTMDVTNTDDTARQSTTETVSKVDPTEVSTIAEAPSLRAFQANTLEVMRATQAKEDVPQKIVFRKKGDRATKSSAGAVTSQQPTSAVKTEDAATKSTNNATTVHSSKSLMANVQWETPEPAPVMPALTSQTESAEEAAVEGPRISFPFASGKFGGAAEPVTETRTEPPDQGQWVERGHDLETDSHKRQKKSKKKHKKEKKSKHKKKKKKERQSSSSDSGNEADSNTQPSDKPSTEQQLVNRLKELKGKRVTAADFW